MLGERVLVCDGAMGTMLHAGGVSLDRCLPELNVSRPELVQTIHRAYIAAGAQVIETNTFGGSRFRLARHGLEDRVVELNVGGVRAAREAQREAGVEGVLIAGSVGPATPAGLGPRLSARDLRRAFGEQIGALVQAGVDLLVLETFGSLDELVEAVGVALDRAGGLPVVAQMTFVDDGRTLGGDTPEEVASTLESLGASVIGANCTLGPQGLLDILARLASATSLPLSAQPNAGPPTVADGHFVYTADPGYFARHARRFVDLGASVVGGCCGTTPAHIQAVSSAVRGLQPGRLSGGSRVGLSGGSRAERSGPLDAKSPPQRVGRQPLEMALNRRAALFGRSAGQQAPEVALNRRAAFFGRSSKFVLACELPTSTGGDAERAVDDARRLKQAGCTALVVPPVASPRAQVSPASIASLVQQRVPGIETILTATTWEKSLLVLQADLLGAHAFGIRHVVCRTGTPPLQADYPNAEGVWDVDSVGLIEVLSGLNAGHDHNGIPLGRPTGFVIGARINPSASDFEREVADARRKVEAGATFLLTPPAFDLEALDRVLDALDAPDVPVLLGVMPLQDVRHAEYLQHEVPEMAVAEAVLERMCRAGKDPAAVGRAIACELATQARQAGRVKGVLLSSASGSADELASLLEALHAA